MTKQNEFDGLTALHRQETDPGTAWKRDETVAIGVNPLSPRSGALTPNVITLREGGYRMYYTGFAPGLTPANIGGHVLSAFSHDATVWTTEPGVRVDVHPPHASRAVLCPDVIPLHDGGYRMYCEARSPDAPTVILSATSGDGLDWELEPGVRFGDGEWSYGSPRCIYVHGNAGELKYRLYFHHYSFPLRSGIHAQNHIISAISDDGLRFEREAGVRIAQESERETYAVYAPEVVRLGDGTYRMYYAAWTDKISGGVFTAVSHDGLDWVKEHRPCLDLGGPRDASMVSEPCVIELADGRSRMFYEARDAAGRCRILSATSTGRPRPG